MTLDKALEKWSVLADMRSVDDISTPQWPSGWYAVCNDDGIIAYFALETDALRWRFDMINRALNP